MLSPVRVVTQVDHTKTVEGRIMKFHHTVAPSRFLSLSVNISKTVADTAQVTINF